VEVRCLQVATQKCRGKLSYEKKRIIPEPTKCRKKQTLGEGGKGKEPNARERVQNTGKEEKVTWVASRETRKVRWRTLIGSRIIR